MRYLVIILSLFLYSCSTSQYEPDPNVVNFELLELSTAAPKWKIGGYKGFNPTDQSEGSIDFYNFIMGTKHALISFDPEFQDKVDRNSEDHMLLVQVYREYLWSLGFKYVAATSAEKDELISVIAESLCEVASVYFDFNTISWNTNLVKLDNIGFSVENCLGETYTFWTDNWASINNSYDWQQLIFTKLTHLFWYDIIRDEDYLMQIPSENKLTEWTEDKLKAYFDNNQIYPLEGIYEELYVEKNVKTGKYKFAIIKTDNGYDLIYIDGATNSKDWKEGEVKAEMIETATPNLYKLRWYMQFKKANDDVYAYVDENNFFTVRYGSVVSENSDVKYLKLYPSVNSDTPNNKMINSSGDFINSGTGFAISQDGLIVTNYHVIDGANQIQLKSHRIGALKTYAAELILADEKNDLAVLKINDTNFKGFDIIPYSFKNKVSDMGTQVYTLGFPLTQTMGESLKLTDGLISSKTGFQGDISLYQVSIPVQPGNSGGPLFDYNGNLIGVINAKHLGAENVTYAIKSNYLENLVELLPMPPTLEEENLLYNVSLPNQIQSIEDFIFLIQIK